MSTGHLCFETTLCAAANTKLPLSRVASLERSRDPVFHLIPNAIKLHLDQGDVLQARATGRVRARFQVRVRVWVGVRVTALVMFRGS